MAKVDTTEQPVDEHDEFAGIEFDDYTPETLEGKYDRHVRGALQRDESIQRTDPEGFEAGKRTRFKIVVPTGEPKTNDKGETTYPAVATERRLVQDSARLRDRTARQVGETNQGDGYTALQFILVPKQSRKRLTDEERAAREAAGESTEDENDDEG